MMKTRIEKGFKVLEETPDSRENVAARLRRARDIIGLDQRSFAEKAGILPQTYGPFETGRRDLTLEAAKKIRKAHGLTLEFMYFGNIADLPHRIAAKL